MPRRHELFALGYSALAAAGELAGYGRLRDSALTGARGRLLVVGLGPGHDLGHLPAEVTDVVAVEPDAAMWRRSARRRERSAVPVHLVAGLGEALPLRGASVDSVLLALVLCTVPEPAAAVAEVRRVLRPGGTLHVMEHVGAPPGSRRRRWQERVAPAWSRMAAGCSVTRDSRRLLEDAGFDTSGLRDVTVRLSPPPVAPHLVGAVAREPGTAPLS